MSNPPEDTPRLDRIETQLESLTAALSATQADVSAIAAGLNSLEGSFKSVIMSVDRLSQRGMANWPVYLSAVIVMILVGTLALTPAYKSTAANASRIDNFFEIHLDQAHDRGRREHQIEAIERAVFSSKIEHSFKKGSGVVQ
jgi:hypothetical protein